MIEQSLMLNHPITLSELLIAKEGRAKQQQILINQYALPLISLTITIPGAIKLTPCSLFLFEQACRQIEIYFQNNQIECVAVIKNINVTGPEGFFVLNQEENQLKQACINIEDSYPLGRLWDIDVISAYTQQSISRTKFGYPARKCLICDGDAKTCARAKIHNTHELIAKIEYIIKENKNIQNDDQSS